MENPLVSSAGRPRGVGARRPTMADARRVAAAVRVMHESISAVGVFGSVARGDATHASDIDLLVLADDATVTRRALIDALPLSLTEFPVSVACFSRERLARLLGRSDSFAAHLRRECVIAWERERALTSLLATPAPLENGGSEIALQLDRLPAFERPERFGGQLLFPLADLYVIAKAVVIGRLAYEGAPEFSRERAFAAMRRRHPDLRDSVDRMAQLRPFWEMTSNRVRAASASLPPATGETVLQVVADIRRVGAGVVAT